MKQLYFLLFFVFTIQLYAQDKRTHILGKIKNRSLAIENVHIINKSSKKGTISDQHGEFKISVRVNDTLVFSNIQYENKIVIINNNHVIGNLITVKLSQKTNELKEIVIIEQKNIAKELGLPNAGKEPLKPIERKLNYIQKGGNIDKLYAWISGEKKKLKILQKHQNEDQNILDNKLNIQIIRNHFKEDFFIYTLKIPKKNIDDFLYFCLPKGTVFLFEKQRYLEVVDIFIQSKSEYLKQTN